MTKKQIILALLPIYKKAIDQIDGLGDIDVANDILSVLRVDDGVCRAARIHLGVSIKWKRWVRRNNVNNSNYWASPPCIVATTDKMVELLQIRVDIMEKELKRK